MSRSLSSLIVPLVVVAGCAVVDPVDLPTGPADPAAVIDPAQIVAEPARAAPGDVVALNFPTERTRGILFVLERRDGDAWLHRYSLTSDGPGPGWQRRWFSAGAEVAVEDIGVGGPGPDRVEIPPGAEPGPYRICTGNAGDEVCAEIEIVAP